MPLPNVMIIGETKCGTTSLYMYLIQHSGIKPSNGNGEPNRTSDGKLLGTKEIRFFDKYYYRGLDWYKSCFQDTSAINIEASPTYFYRAQSMQRIKDVFKDNIKLIVLLRDPVSRLISHYHHLSKYVSDWTYKYPTFENYWNSALEGDYYLIDKGIYYKSAQQSLDLFPKDNIKFVKSEDLFVETDNTYNNVLDFLGLYNTCIRPTIFREGNYSKPINNNLIIQLQEFYYPYNKKLESLIGIGWEYN